MSDDPILDAVRAERRRKTHRIQLAGDLVMAALTCAWIMGIAFSAVAWWHYAIACVGVPLSLGMVKLAVAQYRHREKKH